MSIPSDRAGWADVVASLARDGRSVVDGERRACEATFESIDPATGRVVAEVARGGASEVDAAVAAAQRAFPAWSRTHPRDRASILRAWAELIEQHTAELAALDVLEMGKPITDTVSYDLPETAGSLRFMGEVADKIGGRTSIADHDVVHYTLREPLGVVGCISPWNYPLLMAAWKFAPALAAGNTVVLKPAEQASLSCLRAADLFVEAGGPPGVFNVVPGFGEEAGEALARHMGVAKIAFTGSTAVGRLLLRYAGESNLKRVGLECGGKTPQVVFADVADLDRAVDACVEGIFGNQGEVCNAGSRILVQDAIADEFGERFAAATARDFLLGDPFEPSTTLGPVVDAAAQRAIEAHIDEARADGASVVVGGNRHEGPGCFVEPTAFADVDPDSRLAREEVFGPVAAIMRFGDADDAVALANRTVYGLAAGVWTADLNTAHRMVRDLQAGTIWVNTFNDGDFNQPFGGYKMSGHGRDNSAETVLEYTQTKSAWFRI